MRRKKKKYVKIVLMKPINLQFHVIKFRKFAQKLTATHSTVIYYLTQKMCNKKETYTGKAIGASTQILFQSNYNVTI